MLVKIPNVHYNQNKSKSKNNPLRNKSLQKNDIEKYFGEMIKDINGEIIKVTQAKINEYKDKFTKFINEKINEVPPVQTDNNQENKTSLTPKSIKKGKGKSLITKNIQGEKKTEAHIPSEVVSKNNKNKSVPRKSQRRKTVPKKEIIKTKEEKKGTTLGIEISNGNSTITKNNKNEKSEGNNKIVIENYLISKKRKRGQENKDFVVNIVKNNEINEELKIAGKSKSKSKGKQKSKKKTK